MTYHCTRLGFLASAVLVIAVAAPVQAAPLTAAEKNQYLELAGRVPAEAGYAVTAVSVRDTLKTADKLLRRYAQGGPTFKYEPFVQSLKGTFGANPFDQAELAGMGLNLDKGLVSFGFDQSGPPIVEAFLANREALRRTLGTLASGMGKIKECPAAEKWGAKISYFRLMCEPGSQTPIAFAEKGDDIFIMFYPTSEAWFERHLEAALNLKPEKSLAKSKVYGTLLDRLEAGTDFAYYTNYAVYRTDLKSHLEKIIKAAQDKSKNQSEKDAAADLLSVLVWADSFEAQVLGLTTDENKISFVYASMGAKDKIKAFQGKFAVDGDSRFKDLKLNPKMLGEAALTVRAKQWKEELLAKAPNWMRLYNTEGQKALEKAGMKLDDDLLSAFNGELAVRFYGMNKLEKGLCGGKAVEPPDIIRHFRTVAVMGLKKGADPKKLLEKAVAALRADKRTVEKLALTPGEYYETNVDGLPMQLGYDGMTMYFGLGSGALKEAFTNRAKTNLLGKDVVTNISLDVPALVKDAENLKPDASCTNTQLFELYKMWTTQAAPAMEALGPVKAQVKFVGDGYVTSGEITVK